MQHRITLDGSEATFACRSGQSVLEAMAGSSARGIEVGCRSGGCGVCRVQVLSGRYGCGTMSGAQITDRCREAGIALACQIYPSSDLHLRTLGKRMQFGAEPAAAELIRGLTSRLKNDTGLTMAGAS